MTGEYGGCLPQERYLLEHPSFHAKGWNGAALNSGRSAIYYVLSTAGIHHVYLPYYTCPTIKTFLEERDIQVTEYCIGPDFLPQIDGLDEDSFLLWTNYFGCMKEETMQTAVFRYGHRLILDHCQSFFDEPVPEIFNVYSVRKFVGVSSGSYIYGPVSKQPLIGLPETHYSDEFLRVARQKGSNCAYGLYCENEDAFKNSYGKMPEDVRNLLPQIDYGTIQAIRKRNFQIMHEVLGPYNGLDLDFSGSSPFMYPLYTEIPGLRGELLREQIFCPTWWRRVLELPETSPFEKSLASHLIPLAIDQRYSAERVYEIAEHVKTKLRIG